jgi:hypothetical protein
MKPIFIKVTSDSGDEVHINVGLIASIRSEASGTTLAFADEDEVFGAQESAEAILKLIAEA